MGSFGGSPDGEKSHKISFKIKQKCLGWHGSLYSLPCGRKSINLWRLLSLRGLAGCGVGSNPINLYKVSLLRAMGWFLFLGSPDGEKSHKISFKIKQKFLGWRRSLYSLPCGQKSRKSMEITFPAGIGRVRGRFKSEESFLI